MSHNLNTIEDLFTVLKTGRSEVVSEVKNMIKDQFRQVNDAWLVNGLYDYHMIHESPQTLEILLDLNDPHDKYLLDKICDNLKAARSAQQREGALTILGYVIRKQPSWLYKATLHSLMKELIRILKTEEDLVIIMCALMNLLTMMPILPAHIAPYIQDIFEVFSRVASWRYQHIKDLPEIQQVHIQVGLTAFFHRLYGMFPCNFLSYLRNMYSESNHKDNQAVFENTIKPILYTVKMHPLLVTYTRDQEKHSSRWKAKEVHEIMIEASRYSILKSESTKEDHETPTLDVSKYTNVNKPSLDMTPARLWIKLGTPPPSSQYPRDATLISSSGAASNLKSGYPGDQSPPEAAIEATPDNTPFVTPVKEETFKFTKPLTPQQQQSSKVTGQHDSHLLRSPMVLPPQSPMKEQTPFKFPELQPSALGRRDSIFERPESQSHLINKLSRLGGEKMQQESQFVNDRKEQLESVASSSGPQIIGASSGSKPVNDVPSSASLKRPSPVKFTSEAPERFPIKPEPLGPSAQSTSSYTSAQSAIPLGGKLIPLANLRDAAILDYGKEEVDDEVTEITGGSEPSNSLMTRHITPQICQDSGSTTRTVSRISASSQPDTSSSVTPGIASLSTATFCGKSQISHASPECKSGGSHHPSQDSVNDFVRQVRGRIRFLSVCDQSADISAEVAAALASSPSEGLDNSIKGKRPSSCPEEGQLKMVSIKDLTKNVKKEVNAANIDDFPQLGQELNGESVALIDAAMQTDEFQVFPYEHLFPSVFPQWFTNIPDLQAKVNGEVDVMDPYKILDNCVTNLIAKFDNNSEMSVGFLQDEIKFLQNLMFYERHRREVLGSRNRRLLKKTKSCRMLEERNNALIHQMEIVESEVAKLLHEVETVRKEKHEVEEARAQGAKQRDKKIEEFLQENSQLKSELSSIQSQLQQKESELMKEKQDMQSLQAAFFNAKAEINRLEEKEDLRKRTKEELVHLRQEILLLGELQVKYKEKLQNSQTLSREKEEMLFVQTYERELTKLKNELLVKTNETDNYKSRITELEQKLARKEQDIIEQKLQMQKIHDEFQENLASVEKSNACLMQTQTQLGMQVMELNEKLSLANKSFKPWKRAPMAGSVSSMSSGSIMGLSSPIEENSAADYMSRGAGLLHQQSQGVDIITNQQSREQDIKSSTVGSDERPFIVGSPPLSSGSSDNENLRRILRSDPEDLHRMMRRVENAEEAGLNFKVSSVRDDEEIHGEVESSNKD